MEFRETLLAAQRNQQQKSSESCYYKARFDPPKKEQKRDRLSANIQKFLAKKEEEEKQKKLDAQKKREELLALRDPKALRKIQKTLKVIKSANKSVLADAVDRDNTAVTREGPDQPDQDDYGYESQEAAALYEKMMQKYSKIPDEPKFPTGNNSVKKDLNGTRERVKHALQHEEEPVPHKRRRRGDKEGTERDLSPPTKYEPEKKETKPEKPKFRKPAPPPMDFNQLLKLAEQKKSEPFEVAQKKEVTETNSAERLMTKKQKREYEEEMARRQRRQERIDAEKSGNRRVQKEERPPERDRKSEPSGFGRIPKLSDKNSNTTNISPKSSDKTLKTYSRNTQVPNRNSPKPTDRDNSDRQISDRERLEKQRDKDKVRSDKDKMEKEKERIDRERLERLKAERERIDRDIERLNKDKDRLDKTKNKIDSIRQDKSKIVDRGVDRSKLNSKDSVNKSIDLKSQNTYRIDKNSNERKLSVPSKNSNGRYNMNGQNSQSKAVPKFNKEQGLKNGVNRPSLGKDNRDGSLRVENEKKILSMNKGLPPKRPDERRPPPAKTQGAGPSKAVASSFDFDKHVNSLKKNGLDKNGVRAGDGKRRPHPDDKMKKKRRAVHSDSEYDSEMDDFIDDGDENMDYSTHIKEIFGYDKSKYRDMDDDDDPDMESSFARQQREEYISKKIGIMEDLEDMRLEAMEKKKSKKRRISDD